MTSRKLVAALVRAGVVSSAALVGTLGVVSNASGAACNSPFVKGDVFASIASGSVNVYTPTGTLVCTMNDGTGSFTTGSAFDTAGNFYVTNFGSSTSKFDNSGNLLNPNFMLKGSISESIDPQATGFYAGSSLVGGPSSPTIAKFDTATGTLTNTYTVATQGRTGGTDWVDVYDPSTGQVIYTGEGQDVKSAILNPDGSVTQLPNFATGVGDIMFALRTIGSGPDAGDVLVANSINALLLSPTGSILHTYSLPGVGDGVFSLNLDPNGTDFWTGDFSTTNVWEVNIDTGAIDQQWMTGTGVGTFYGLSVFGEIHEGGSSSGGTAPEPASLALLGTGLAAFYLARRRKPE